MKSQRHAKILEIVSSRDVETQEQLLEALQDAGFYSTQATISRDIKELRIVKELTKFGTYRYSAASKELGTTFSTRLHAIFRECVTSFDYAQNIIVVHTLPGLANAAASALDTMNMSVILGTIAGDDTVFIVMRDNNAAAQFCGEISNLTCSCSYAHRCKHEVAVMLQLCEALELIRSSYGKEFAVSRYFAALSRHDFADCVLDNTTLGDMELV